MGKIKITIDSKNQIPDSEKIIKIMEASIDAVDPYLAVLSTLRIKHHCLCIEEKEYTLKDYRKIFVIAIGKAALKMALAVRDKLGKSLSEGIAITKHADPQINKSLLPVISTFEGNHPVPDEKSISCAQLLIEFSKKIQPNDLVICLISGGGSALITKPAEGLALRDLIQINELLLRCGATINEINIIRKHLDHIKGGGLAGLIHPANLITLILSDVVGDSLSTIASGPTVADESSFIDAWQVLKKYDLQEKLNTGTYKYFQKGIRGEIRETIKPGDQIIEKVQNVIVANNQKAAFAGLKEAELSGFNSQVLTNYLQGDSKEVGKLLGSWIKKVKSGKFHLRRPVCLIAGGESTVVVKGDGLGGRNQEVALACAMEIETIPDVRMTTLATDGEDGPTTAAGAIVTGDTVPLARKIGMDPEKYLMNNDSFYFFEKMGGLIKTGSTGTNVNDLSFLLIH